MTFLPIVDRELRVAARRPATWRIRWLNALVALTVFAVILWVAHKSNGFGGLVSPGKMVFSTVSFLAFVFCLFEGVRLTTDSISGEKREGTLGLLFLTDLTGKDVVLGKLSATSLNSLYGLLGAFPVMGITLLMGGVTFGEVTRMSMALAMSLIFSACLGIWISARSRDEGRPLLAALTIQVVINFIVPAFLLKGITVTPFAMYWGSFATVFMVTPSVFWSSLSFSAILSGLLIWHAGRLTGRNWHDVANRVSPLRYLWEGSSRTRTQRRDLTLDVNPVEWLAGRRRMALAGFAGLAMFWSIVVAGTLIATNDVKKLFEFVPSLSMGMAFTFKVGIACAACLCFMEARRSGALELWLCTPLTVKQIIAGQRRAMQSFLVMAIATAASAYLVVGIMLSLWGWEANWRLFWYFGMPMVMGPSPSGGIANDPTLYALALDFAVFALDVYALMWVGMWFGLKSGGVGKALMRTYGFVVVVPWLITVAMTIAATNFIVREKNELIFITAGVALAKAVAFSSWAAARLKQNFKLIASEPSTPRPSRLQWLGNILHHFRSIQR